VGLDAEQPALLGGLAAPGLPGWELRRDQIVLTPISVPNRLVEAGMTP
jgi:hypothetical protein